MMSFSPKYQHFSVVRFAERQSIQSLHERLDGVLDPHKGRSRNKNGHISLFKLSMLSREARRTYFPPSSYEMQTRSYDQRNPTWDPYHNVTFDSVGARAIKGCLMIRFDADQVAGDHKGALHAAKIRTNQFQRDFYFDPHLIAYRYDESSVASIDQMYEDEAILADELRENPIAVEFRPASITGALRVSDRISEIDVFQPKRVAETG